MRCQVINSDDIPRLTRCDHKIIARIRRCCSSYYWDWASPVSVFTQHQTFCCRCTLLSSSVVIIGLIGVSAHPSSGDHFFILSNLCNNHRENAVQKTIEKLEISKTYCSDLMVRKRAASARVLVWVIEFSRFFLWLILWYFLILFGCKSSPISHNVCS